MLSPLNKTITQKDVRAEDSIYLNLPGVVNMIAQNK